MAKIFGILIGAMLFLCIIIPPLGFGVIFAFVNAWYELTKPSGPLIRNEISNYHSVPCAREEINTSADCYFLNKAKTKVYFEPGYDEAWGPPESTRVKGADVATFKHVGNLAMDKNNVYYEAEIIPDLSPIGWQRMSGGYLVGKSKSNLNGIVFNIRRFHSQPIKAIEGVDVNSFKVKRVWGSSNKNIYAVDKNNVYLRGEVISNKSKDFARISNEFHQRYLLLSNADLKEKIERYSFEFFTDGETVFWLDGFFKRTLDLNPLTTEILVPPVLKRLFS